MQFLNILLPAILAATSAADPDPEPEATTAQTSAEQGGRIIMYRRGSVVGAALGCPIRYRGEELTELARGKFAEWRVLPGRYILENRTASVEVNVAAGETRFVRCQIKSGFASGRADLQIVDGTEFEKLQDTLKRSDKSPD